MPAVVVFGLSAIAFRDFFLYYWRAVSRRGMRQIVIKVPSRTGWVTTSTCLRAQRSVRQGPLFRNGETNETVSRGRSWMIAAILFMVSIVALGQFGLYYWRAMISGVAAQAISDRIRSAAGITAAAIGAQDFYKILIVNDLSPDLRGPGGSFRAIRTYYAIVEKLGSIVPAMASWSNAEMTTCSRYVAVLMDQHLERNMACAAQMRGM